MHQRSLRRRQSQRKMLHRRTIRRSLFFISEQSAQPLWCSKSGVKKHPQFIAFSEQSPRFKAELDNPAVPLTSQKPQTE